MTISDVKALLNAVPHTGLGFYPTPLYKLERLSARLGINLYIKRDDFSGRNLFGGNKVRKLEYLIGKALQDGCDTVITYGATQSNHAMQTCWTAAASGLQPIVYLTAVVEPNEDDIKANLLLDRIFGAEVHVEHLQPGEDMFAAGARVGAQAKARMQELAAEGHKVMEIPGGGANEIGTAGYIAGMIELAEQAENMGLKFDALYHATGSGGTMAGLVAGKKLLGLKTAIRSVSVSGINDTYITERVDLARAAVSYIGGTCEITEDDFCVETDYYGPGYEMPDEASSYAIRLLARTEGLLVDPVYSGKAFSGLLGDVEKGIIKPGSTVVFLHTGGTTALFAEKEILGNIY